jgi:D-3-phosphoglycerate dehydrogenase
MPNNGKKITKILVIDHFPQDFLDKLRALPVSVTYIPDTNREEVLELIPETDVLILNSKVQVDRELIDAGPNLKMAIRAGVGMDHFDLPYCEEKGIRAVNTAGANADSVAEHTVGMLLAMRHNLVRADREVKQMQWLREKNRGLEIKEKTIGIIGYGHTGSAVAKRLSGFGCDILVYDKYLLGFGNEFVREVKLNLIFEEADIVTLHIPLTEETRNFADATFFNQFAKPIHFLNLSRGPITDLISLRNALDQGKVLGAALDVLPNEKLNLLSEEEKGLYQDIFSRENVMLSPHIGGWSVESLSNINEKILDWVKEEIDV